MKIAVTGATGFIGSHVIQCLVDRGFEVIASSTDSEKARKASWFQKVSYIPFQLSSQPSSVNLFEKFNRPDLLIHLVWQGLPNYNSLHHIEENIFSNYFFLKNFVLNGLQNLTVTGTCLEYGMQSGKLNEAMPSEPETAYAIGKHALHLFLKALQKENTFSFKWIRLFYLYGPGQAENSLIPQLERALKNGDAKFPMSGGLQKRDFLPVEECAQYIIDIALQKKTEGTINCCSGNPVTVKDFIGNYLSKKNQTIELDPGKFPYPVYEPMEFWGDNSKLKEILNH